MKAVFALVVLSILTHNLNGQEQTDTYDEVNDVTDIITTITSNTSVVAAAGKPSWRVALDKLQLIMTLIGVFANVLTMVLIWKAGQRFTSLIKILLQHQSFVDGMICLLAIPILTQPFNWVTGNISYDTFMCHIWHSQVFFWAALYVSVWNLVLVAIERYIAVIHPLKHNNFTKCKLLTIILMVYVTASIVFFSGFMQVSFEDESCSHQYFFRTESYKAYMSVYSIYWFFAAYAVPCLLFIVLYGTVMISLHRRKSDTRLGQSRIIDQASAQFTRTAILVTAFFMFSLSFDSFYYLLGTVGVATYIHGSPLQRVALFFTCMNSVANPFLYVISMPAFRQSIKQLFCRGKYAEKSDSRVHSNSTAHSNINMTEQSQTDSKY